jgi:hypothetical protein
VSQHFELPIEQEVLLQYHLQNGRETVASLPQLWQSLDYREFRGRIRLVLPSTLVSVAVCLLGGEGRQGRGSSIALDILGTRRLPYSVADASLLLSLAARRPGRQEIRVAIKASEVALAKTPDPVAMEPALIRLLAAVELGRPDWPPRNLDLVPSIRSLLALVTGQASPDFTTIGSDDHFGPATVEIIRAHYDREAELSRLLTILGSPRGPRLTESLRKSAVTVLTTSTTMQNLVFEMATLLTSVPLMDTSKERHGIYAPPRILVSETNTPIAVSSVWFCQLIERDDRSSLLGQIALRCSAANFGHMAAATLMTTPLSPKVANAAIDTLASLPGDEGRAELERLFFEVPLASTFRRIARLLGKSESEVQARIKDARAAPKAHLAPIRRISTRPGDVGFLALISGHRVYLQLACRTDLGDLIRVLPGRHADVLDAEALLALVSGPSEFLTLGMFTATLQLPGADKVGKFPVPPELQVCPPLRVGLTKSARAPRGWSINFNGVHMSDEELNRLHPEIDQTELPFTSVPFPGLLRSRIEAGWRPWHDSDS